MAFVFNLSWEKSVAESLRAVVRIDAHRVADDLLSTFDKLTNLADMPTHTLEFKEACDLH